MRAAERARVGLIDPPEFRRLLFDTPIAFQRVIRAFRPVMERLGAAEQQREKLAALGPACRPGWRTSSTTRPRPRSAPPPGLADALDVLDGVMREFVESGVERAEAEAFLVLKAEAIARATDAVARDGLDGRRRRGRDRRVAGGARRRRGVAAGRAARLRRARRRVARGRRRPGRRGAPDRRALDRHHAHRPHAERRPARLDRSACRSSCKAIKAYTYMDQAALQEVDVHEGIDATLTILNHKLKHTRIAVERRLRRRPAARVRLRVRAQPGLDEPARQRDRRARRDRHDHDRHRAVARQRRRGADLRRRPGHPRRSAAPRLRAVLHHEGRSAPGTGLGLDTTRRIVRERHDGDVRLDSRPGRTTFTVRLPRAPAQGLGGATDASAATARS